jgi:hypothetical protein
MKLAISDQLSAISYQVKRGYAVLFPTPGA